ncbi:MAG: patatin-like phospholipase family protein [Ottowia sp.]|nr:patatin-like phospholipase family protein [Ottowia sp.]
MTARAAPAPPARAPHTALLLTGGGARAAYQVGVLKAIAQLQARRFPGARVSPFDIIVGTSAGAINAASIACSADDFQRGVRRLSAVWSRFHAAQVYHANAWHTLGTALRWGAFGLLGWFAPLTRLLQPHSLLDNEPLQTLLQRELPLARLPQMLAQGYLRALAVTTSSYTSGEHVTFYTATRDIQDWQRVRRRAVRTPITIPHLMASSAIPLLFPATRINAPGASGYYGDGSMRQIAPLAPVVHLGAQRILVIGVARALEPMDAPAQDEPVYPSFAQVANHALASIFLDTLAADAERLHRINHTLSLIAPEARSRSHLRRVELLTIMPSRRIDQIAARHTRHLPWTVRMLMRMLGMRGGSAGARSSALASYLLFEREFTSELIRLGHADGLAQQAAIERFFGWTAD